jgi:hypothetical protein
MEKRKMLESEMREGTVVLIPEVGLFGEITGNNEVKPETGALLKCQPRDLVFIATSKGGNHHLRPFIDASLKTVIEAVAKFFWWRISSLERRSNELERRLKEIEKKIENLPNGEDEMGVDGNSH